MDGPDASSSVAGERTLVSGEVERLSDGAYQMPSHARLPSLICRRSEDRKDWTLFSLRHAMPPAEYETNVRDAPFVYPRPFLGERRIAGPKLSFAPAAVASGANARPVLRDASLNLQVLNNRGEWERFDLKPIVRAWVRDARPEHQPSALFETDKFFGSGFNMDERVAIDRDCNLYTIVQGNRSEDIGDILVLVSTTGGQSWKVHPLGVHPSFLFARLEHSTSARLLDRPPAVLIHTIPACLSGTSPCRVPPARTIDPCSSGALGAPIPELAIPDSNPLLLVPFEKQGDDVRPVFHEEGRPFVVSRHSIVGNMHAGAPRVAVSVPFSSMIHIVYPTTHVEPIVRTWTHGDPPVETSCAYSATRFDLATFDVAERRFVVQDESIGHAPLLLSPTKPYPPTDEFPGFDDHDQPALALSSDGFIHLVISGHNTDLSYARSREPLPERLVFEEPVLVQRSTGVGRGTYTYPSMVADERGNVHIVARSIDSPDEIPDPRRADARLAVYRLVYLRFRNDRSNRGFDTFFEPGTRQRLPHSVIVDPNRNRYAIFYNKLQTDRLGRLWVQSYYRPSQLTNAEALEYQRLHPDMPVTRQDCFEDTAFGPDPSGAPGLIRCAYDGIQPEGPFLYRSLDGGQSFRLAETRDFDPAATLEDTM